MSLDEAILTTVREVAERHLRDLRMVAPEYLDTEQAADYLGFSVAALKKWRCNGEGPPYTKTAQAVRYRRADLDEFMAARRRG